MKNDVSKALARWTEKIELTRFSSGTYVDGVWVNGSSAIIQINAVVQNAQADDLILLKEGTRSTEAIKIHTTAKVKTVSEYGESNADVFLYNGRTYKIYDVFERKIGNYYRAVAIRIDI